ncbi:hypothetical protein [Bacillus paralicheniformis]|uniref:hypothetical protein n=1 Tax=Bacillus paralicheniformis TaxID=1648923 RepID=UPI000D04620E|nr:hypothetical protein [Bacillus paralicheniformis]
MKISERYFPHPVLTFFDDNIDGTFEIEEISVELDVDKTHYTVSGKFLLDNADIIKLIDDYKAAYVLHLECGKTRFRKPFHFTERFFSFKVASDLLDGKIEMQPAVIVKTPIPNYQNDKSHKDFSNSLFDLRIGELLAVSYPMEFTVTKSLDSLRNFPSIFSVSKNTKYSDNPIEVNFEDSNRIRIYLSEKNYRYYKITSQQSANEPILASMILLPVLVQLFNYFAQDMEHFEDAQWLPAIQKRVNECGYTFEDINWESESIQVAHKVIGDALSNGLKVLVDKGDD